MDLEGNNMYAKEAGFRRLYKHFCVFKALESDLDKLKELTGERIPEYFLAFGYIDKEQGLMFEVIACAEKILEGFRFAKTRADIRIPICYRDLMDREVFLLEDHILHKQYKEKVAILKTYDVSDDVEETRRLSLIDDCRDTFHPDDILVYFLKEGLEAEGCWVRAKRVGEKNIVGTLINDPNQYFGVRKGDDIEFRLSETDDKKLVCVKRF